MLIVLEGVDGAGKTTLSDALADKHNGPVSFKHCGPLQVDPMIAYEWELRDYDRKDMNSLTICDRWHVGELIYGKLYRGRSMLSLAAAKHVELFLESRGALRVLVTDAVGTIEDRLKDRGETFLQPEHLGLVWDFFNDYAEQSDGWEIVHSTKVSVRNLLDRARSAQFNALKLAGMESYVGSPWPRFLVLEGHRHFQPSRPKYQAAITPSFVDNRNMAIMERLLPYDDFGMLSQDADQIRSAWPFFDRPPVIAVDSEAAAAAAIAGIKAWSLKSLDATKIMEETH